MFKNRKRIYSLLMEEKDVTTILKVTQEFLGCRAVKSVGSCGWKDEPEMWFIHLDISKDNYATLLAKLSYIGHIKADVRKKGIIDFRFIGK